MASNARFLANGDTRASFIVNLPMKSLHQRGTDRSPYDGYDISLQHGLYSSHFYSIQGSSLKLSSLLAQLVLYGITPRPRNKATALFQNANKNPKPAENPPGKGLAF